MPNATDITTRPIRVLIVDDDPSIQVLYDAYLTKHGCECDRAVSGRDALQILMRRSFDVVVVDLRMEEMEGLVFVEESLRIWPWIGVIISSGYVTSEVVDKAAELGVTRVLRKSSDLHELVRAVREEAEEKRRGAIDIPKDSTLRLMRSYIRLLTRLTESDIGIDLLVDELRHFGETLAQMLHADISGIIFSSEDEQVIVLAPQRPLSCHVLETVQQEMVERYCRLSGHELELTDLERRTEGTVCSDDAPSEVGKVISVPIMLERDVCGLLTLGAIDDAPYAPSEISLLYHAANHVSAVFLALRRMHALATHDALTSVLNRVRLEEELSQAWQLSHRYDYSMGFLIIDVDDFKTVNDSLGHAVGDEILREFAHILKHVARTSDVIARYGGDEFVAILQRADDNEALAFGQRLLNAVREHTFCEDSHALSLTISIGISTSANSTRPGSGMELMRQADRALYMAKRAGKNGVIVWPGSNETQEGPKGNTAQAGAPLPERSSDAPRIMIVDDEPSILHVLELLLDSLGYATTSFSDSREALTELQKNGNDYAILLTDLAMPEVSGIELITIAASETSMTVPIVLTAWGSKESAVNCLRAGVYDFVEKPIDTTYLPVIIERALSYRKLRIDNEHYQNHLEQMVKERSSKLAASLESLRASYDFTLKALVGLLDVREKQTGEHSLRVRELAVVLATQMGMTGRDVEIMASAALLHDIGKIGIADQVLLKPSSLDTSEWQIMKRHPSIGYEILRTSPFLQEAATIVWQHHEHVDGSGYPQGLAGDAIDIRARIFTVADAYDCMRSHRVYRGALTPDEARAEIGRSRSTQFDSDVVDAFIECQSELENVLSAHALEAKDNT